MNVFLTGGTGFIGQVLIGRMRRRGWDIKALVRDVASPAAQWMARRGVMLAQGDVTAPEGLEKAMAGSDVLIHAAGVYEIGADAATRKRAQRVNVDGTENILAAANAVGIARNIYFSSVAALGATGRAPAPSVTCDETRHHDGRYLSAYERSKAEAHQVALRWRNQGLPLVIAMPGPVVGANDHSIFGYFLRLTLLGAMPPIAFGGDAVAAWVDVDALTDGICLAVEHASMGEDYLFCGERGQLRELFDLWRRETSRMTPRVYLPRALMRPLMGLLEPLERALGLPAFFSRETVDVTRGHLDYSSAKAKRDLGWDHPGLHEMWPPIIRREKDLMDSRTGFLSKLRHLPVIPD